MKKALWIITVILAILVGIIPFTYLTNLPQGFFELKDQATLKSAIWNTGFYIHIFSGGIAITIGWIQFSKKILRNRVNWHRTIGKIYVIAAILCGFFGIFIGFWATGGLMAQLGFSIGGFLFFYTTLLGYLHIRRSNIIKHQQMMTYSYALCLAAINLRLFMTLLMLYFNDYYTVYIIISWMSWIPNLFIAYWINKNNQEKIPIVELN